MNEPDKFRLDVIHPMDGDVILIQYDIGDVTIEEVSGFMDVVKQMFPRNHILCAPSQMSIADLDRIDVREHIRSLKQILENCYESW